MRRTHAGAATQREIGWTIAPEGGEPHALAPYFPEKADAERCAAGATARTGILHRVTVAYSEAYEPEAGGDRVWEWSSWPGPQCGKRVRPADGAE